MSEQNMKNVVVGPELERIIEGSLGEVLLLMLKSHDDNILQVRKKNKPSVLFSLILILICFRLMGKLGRHSLPIYY